MLRSKGIETAKNAKERAVRMSRNVLSVKEEELLKSLSNWAQVCTLNHRNDVRSARARARP